jgi:hypothetical protein
MDSALYFPHTTPRDKTLLKEALLLWDELEFIVPWEGFVDHHADRETTAALDVFGRPITPSSAAKRRTHSRIEQLVGEGLPGKYLFQPGGRPAPIYADKLAGETWQMLQDGEMIGGQFRLRRGNRFAYSYDLAAPLALAIMTVLADECAGKTARKVTDAAYASDAQAAYLTRDLGGDLGRINPEHETYVMALPAPVIALQDVSITQLTKLRQNESGLLQELRRNYRTEVNKYLADISAPDTKDDDYRRIAEGFSNRMRVALAELDRALDRRNQVLDYGIAEVIVPGFVTAAMTYAVSSSSLAAAITGATEIVGVGLFKILGSIPANAEKREEILKKNPAAWLYHVQAEAST